MFLDFLNYKKQFKTIGIFDKDGQPIIGYIDFKCEDGSTFRYFPTSGSIVEIDYKQNRKPYQSIIKL